MKEKLLELLETKGDLPPLSDILINLEGRIKERLEGQQNFEYFPIPFSIYG